MTSKAILTLAFSAIFSGRAALAQQPAILEIDVENYVQYFEDISDHSKLATDPGVTTAVIPKNFFAGLVLADIVAVNGQPAKGILIRDARNISLNANPAPGQAIADNVRNAVAGGSFEILKSDGTPVGTIVTYGFSGGSPPPGAPSQQTSTNFAIVGGTGAYLGARGEYGQATTAQTVAARQASMSEDPANRRRNGGGRARFVLQVIPMNVPQILAVAHSADFTEVTQSLPAAPGETLSIVATGMGPCQPATTPNSLPTINSPVDVLVNGNAAKVLAAVCYSGQVQGYQVNFQVPAGAAAGTATLQLSAAWIPSGVVSLAMR